MEIKHSYAIDDFILIAGSQLLKHIHVTKLQIVGFVRLVRKAEEETILIKIIVDDLLSEIDMHFVIEHKRESLRLNPFSA